MKQITNKITIGKTYRLCFGRHKRFNNGNPYTTYNLGFIRVDVFKRYIGY